MIFNFVLTRYRSGKCAKGENGEGMVTIRLGSQTTVAEYELA